MNPASSPSDIIEDVVANGKANTAKTEVEIEQDVKRTREGSPPKPPLQQNLLGGNTFNENKTEGDPDEEEDEEEEENETEANTGPDPEKRKHRKKKSKQSLTTALWNGELEVSRSPIFRFSFGRCQNI